MNFLGIGPLELVLIIVLALIFVGPDELPVVMRKLAKFLKELQNLSADVSSQLREEFGPELEEFSRAASELQEATKAAHKAQEFVSNPIKAVSGEAMQVIAPPSTTEPPTTDAPEEKAAPEATSAPATPKISTRPLTPLQGKKEEPSDDASEAASTRISEPEVDTSNDGRSAS